MEANEKTFRHSFGKLALMFLGVLFLGLIAFLGETDYFLFTLMGIVLVIALFYATSSVTISSEEITTHRLLGLKSLRWPEIARVSTRGQALRLHNYDDDLILSIDSQLDGYTEIIDVIFRRRPDLFDNNENSVMSSGWLGTLLSLGLGLLIIAVAAFFLFIPEDVDKTFSLIFLAVGLYITGSWFLSPKSITLEGTTLLVRYFFKEASYSAGDIKFISLEKKQTRNGYIYFVQINLESGEKIKLPTFKQGSALTYQILKRWHEKARNVAREIQGSHQRLG